MALNTLLAFQYQQRYVGEGGENGRGKRQKGRRGESVVIGVPVGTLVYEKADGEWRLLGDLVRPGQRVLVVKGGRGGRGNAHFASAINRAPLLAEAGERGEEAWLVLELKLLADVAIIGAPNAGKSTLLSALSAARPKVAPYPFTTTEPVLGVVRWKGMEFVMAEVPGLLEGAHRGAGLGHHFLRHAERSHVLLHLVDGSSPDPVKEYRDINWELVLYKESLAAVPQVVVAGEGVEAVLRALAERLGEQRAAPAPAPSPPPTLRPRRREAREVIAEGERVWRLGWPRAERLAALVDLGKPRVAAQLWRELGRMGAVRALEAKGARSGDTVLIGEKALRWP